MVSIINKNSHLSIVNQRFFLADFLYPLPAQTITASAANNTVLKHWYDDDSMRRYYLKFNSIIKCSTAASSTFYGIYLANNSVCSVQCALGHSLDFGREKKKYSESFFVLTSLLIPLSEFISASLFSYLNAGH